MGHAAPKARPEKVPTADVRAYDFYLRGRHFFHQFRRRGLDLAGEMFAHAIAIDPRYARAYARHRRLLRLPLRVLVI
jgi:hypothetical protein